MESELHVKIGFVESRLDSAILFLQDDIGIFLSNKTTSEGGEMPNNLGSLRKGLSEGLKGLSKGKGFRT